MISSSHAGMKSSQLMKLFEDELKDIYWAEKALTKAIPNMIEKSTSEELMHALQNHLTQTEQTCDQGRTSLRIDRSKSGGGLKCEAIAGLIKEADDIMDECEKGPMRDAGIISAAQKVEHYEIATYARCVNLQKPSD